MVTLLPLLGVVRGAALQSTLARHADRKQQDDALRSQTYSDYLRAVAAAAHVRSDEDLRDALREAADAKARMAVHGTSSAVSALARFETEGAALTERPAADAFIDLVKCMRSHIDLVPDSALRIVLLGTGRPRPLGPTSARREVVASAWTGRPTHSRGSAPWKESPAIGLLTSTEMSFGSASSLRLAIPSKILFRSFGI